MTAIEYSYPDPQAPVSPILSWEHISLRRQSSAPDSILRLPNLVEVTSGRAAISLALELLGIQQGDQVLIPAFHCESMVSPARWRKASPVFYKVNPDTSIDLDDIKAKINKNTRVIIATHYFGFLQDLRELSHICKENNIFLIEDCAHSFFGERNGIKVGELGDFAIASSMKYFPVYDGGILASTSHSLSELKLTAPPKLFSLKSAVNALERSIKFSRLGLLGRLLNSIFSAQSSIRRFLKTVTNSKQATNSPGSSDGGYGLDENWIHKESTLTSSYIIHHSEFESNKLKRKQNYERLHSALSMLPGVTPLFPDFPETMTPLIYPLCVAQPEEFFPRLKNLGVPIWRFGEFLDPEVDESVCQNSTRLSAQVFQFPCHQELTSEELDWMIKTITEVFRD